MKKALQIISGIILIILGLFLMIRPLVALNSIAIMVGVIILIQGNSEIIDYSNSEDKSSKGWNLFSAILSLIIGILILFSPINLVLTAMLPFMFATWVTFKGVMQCIKSINLNKVQSTIWGYVLTLGILNILIGVLMFVNPLIPAFTLAFYIGIGFILAGVSAISFQV